MEIRQSFESLLTTRLEAEPGALDGPGISSDWNRSVYSAPEQVADWAADQIDAADPTDLVAAGLFSDAPGGVRISPGLDVPGSPVVLLRETTDGPPSGFYAADSALDYPVSTSFFTDLETRRLAQACSGVVVVADSAREVAAWRRIGLAAIPIPPRQRWEAEARRCWINFVAMKAVVKAQLTSTASPVDPFADRLLPTLVVSRLDPISVDIRPATDFDSRVSSIRRFWQGGSADYFAYCGSWEPSEHQINLIRKAVVEGTPSSLHFHLLSSLRTDLSFIPPFRRVEQPAPNLTTLRRAVTALGPTMPIEQRTAARENYRRGYESFVVEPMLDAAASMEATDDRTLAMAQAGLMQCFGELQTDMLLAGAVGAADVEQKSAHVRDLCRLSAEIRSLARAAKEESRGRRR